MAVKNEIGIRLTLQGEQQVKTALSGVEGQMERLTGAVARAGHYGAAFVGVTQGLIPMAQAAIRAADAATILNNQLKLATGSTQAAGQAYQDLYDIAQRSRVSFTELGGTFASISRAGKEMGLSQQRLLGVTETISNAMTVSGGAAAGMNAALMQLGQGLSSGVLRGEELNSVMEQAPRLAKALADGLGVPIGKLREMGAAGELSSEKVIRALESQSAVLRGEVSGAAMTVGQAMTQMQNAAVLAIGELDKATGVSVAVAAAMSSVAMTVGEAGRAFKENEEAIRTGMGALAGAAAAAGVLAVAGNIGKVTLAVRALGIALSANPYVLAVMGIGTAVGAFSAYADAKSNSLDAMKSRLKELQSLESKGDRGMYGSRVSDEALAKRRAEIKRLQLTIAELDNTTLDTRAEDARMAAMVRSSKAADSDRDAYVKLSRTLSGFKGDYKEYTDNQALINRLRDSGAISEKEAAKRLGELAEKHGMVSDSAKKSAAEAKKAADALKKSYQDAMGAAASQARDLTSETDQLNPAQKKLADIMAEPAWAKWTETQRQAVKALFDRNSETIKAQELAKAEAKWMDESAAENLKFAESAFEAADAVEKQVQEQLLANQAIGLSAVALADLEAARLRDAAAEKTRLAAVMDGIDPSVAESYRRQAAAMTELATAKQAGATKEAAVEANRATLDEWTKTVEKYDDIFREGFAGMLNGGKEGWKSFTKSLTTTFKTAVADEIYKMLARPFVVQLVASLAGVTGLSSLSSAANAATGGGGSALGTAGSLYDAYRFLSGGIRDSISNGFTKLASTEYGQKFGLYDADAGVRGLTESGQAINGTLQSAGSAMTAYSISKALSGEYKIGNGKIMDALTAVAGWFDPTGGLLSGAISAGLNRAFGMGAKKVTGSGISGTFSASGASVREYADWQQKGGWFRSDKNGTQYSSISSELDNLLDAGLQSITAATKGYASALGLSANAVKGFSQSIKVSLKGLDEAGQQKAIADALASFGTAMSAKAYSAALAPFQRAGETMDATLTRLGGSLTLVNGTLKTLGQTLYDVSVRAGDMASSLLDKFGGAEAFSAAAASYYQNFYTEAERTGAATTQVSAALKALGYAMPATREGFRDLVEAQVLTTESGRTTYAALMGLESAFAALVPSTDDLAAMAQHAGDAISSLFGSLTDSIAQGRTAVVEARASIGINQRQLSYADLVKRVGGVSTAPPSRDALDKAKNAVTSAKSTVDTKQADVVAAKSAATSVVDAYKPMYDTAQAAYNKSLKFYGDASAGNGKTFADISYFDLATPAEVAKGTYKSGFNMPGDRTLSDKVWAAFNYATITLPKLAKDATAAVKAADTGLKAAQSTLTAAESTLTKAETAYTTAMTKWVDGAATSVGALDRLRESTVEYYEQQKELASLMLTSAANVRAAVKQARMDTMTGAESLATRLSDYDKTYTLALSASGSVKAGYADQMAAALPQLSQDLAATSASRADWAVAVAKLSAKGEKVAGQLDAAAPKDYQAEANTLLGLIDAKLVSLNDAAKKNEAALTKAVTDGSTRTAAGLQQIINQLQGKKVSAFAKGGAFTNGVVDTPTLAPMALFGEAGPEAIMPLSRGPGGVLGVRVHGGSGPDESGTTERLLRDLVDEVRRLRTELQATQSEISSMRRENNIGNAEIATQTKKSARMAEKWDVVGLPATATA